MCSQLPFKVSESTLCCIGHVLLIWNEYCDTGVGLSENLSIKAPSLGELTKSIALNFVFTNFEQKSLGWEVAQNTIVFCGAVTAFTVLEFFSALS